MEVIDYTNPKVLGLSSTYGKGVTLAMTLNYIIGTGCFGLPFAFTEAGLVLTSLFLIIGVLAVVISMNYTLEALARAEGVSSTDTTDRYPLHRLTYRKFDFTTMGRIFGGRLGEKLIQTVLIFYCVGTLWSYASVFCSSVASLFYSYVMETNCDVYSNPTMGCLNAYYGSMVLYSVIVITLVLMDLSEQSTIQKFLSIYRIVAIVVMLVTLVIKVFSELDAVANRVQLIGSFDWKNFGKGFGPSILAVNCHYNMPDALQPLNQKKHARFVAFASLILSGSLYIFLGLFGAVAFESVNPLVSLNWSTYTGCGNGWTPCTYTNPLGIFIQLIVQLFPVVNVASTYPMVGVTMGDNLHVSVSKGIKSRYGSGFCKKMCRLVAAVPPLIMASAFKRLDLILSIAGLFGFCLGLSIPCWLQISSLDYCMNRWDSALACQTPFTLPIISSRLFALSMLIVSFVITIIATVTLFT